MEERYASAAVFTVVRDSMLPAGGDELYTFKAIAITLLELQLATVHVGHAVEKQFVI
jgi:hypothetical protein